MIVQLSRKRLKMTAHGVRRKYNSRHSICRCARMFDLCQATSISESSSFSIDPSASQILSSIGDRASKVSGVSGLNDAMGKIQQCSMHTVVLY